MGKHDIRKVVIVDDSAVIRALLKKILNDDPRLDVVGVAKDPYEAREIIKKTSPDVLTLDIEMPRMNGLTFLSNLMRLRPMPVVMISTLTVQGATSTLEALELGAIDFLAKPASDSSDTLREYASVIVEKVYSASFANLDAFPVTKRSHERADSVPTDIKLKGTHRKINSGFLCAIGASTGGTEAIREVLAALPVGSPPVVIVQHIPVMFSTSFAKRLNDNCELRVFHAENGQAILPGNAYVAPGDQHLKVVKQHGVYQVQLSDGQLVNRHKPSVEVLFDSVRESAGSNCIGALLTGMGDDGAHALLRMREAGCMTVAQDEESSVVWGMPGVAAKIGAAQKVVALNKIAEAIYFAGTMN